MEERIRALLVQKRYDPLDALRCALEDESIDVLIARNCAEAGRALLTDPPPHMAFTDVELPDGGWEDVLALSMQASAPVNLIVVAPYVDVGFYVEVIQQGAFDFIVPPHSRPELLHVVRTATQNALTRRRKPAATLPAPNQSAATA
jgi:DNA-binding NtrC family response regulator